MHGPGTRRSDVLLRRATGVLAVLFAAGFGAAVPALADSASGATWPVPGAFDPYRVRVLLFEAPKEVTFEYEALRQKVKAVRGGLQAGSGKPIPAWRTGSDEAVTRVGSFRVRGRVEAVRTEDGIAVINDVPLERYLAGILGREMYPGWHGEALRAQAVASRTYALYRAERAGGRQNYAVTAGTSSQVYRGVDAESTAVWEAVRATRGEILTQAGHPILAAFHSDAGGRTASSAEVWGEKLTYLTSLEVIDEGDSPDTYWRSAIARTTLRRALDAAGKPVGRIKGLDVVKRADSGRVLLLKARGTDRTIELTGRELRRALGQSVIRSTLFEVRETDEGIAFVGSGRGHGVGMSQWGARAMAERGANYREILEHFYPGAALGSLDDFAGVVASDSSAAMAKETGR